MKSACVSMCALLAATAVYGADLPTKNEPRPAPEKASCFSDPLHYFDSSPTDCPLSALGLTLYATIDIGVGYETHGVPLNRRYPPGFESLVSKNSNRSQWLLTPNGISQSQIGVKAKETIGMGWSFVGEVATGFDPYTLQLANGPGSLVDNNFRTLPNQTANGDSSRAGQWYNSVGYAGVSNETFGTLTVGRQNSLFLDGVNAYDPMGGSNAFSPIGYSGRTAGASSTEDARINTSVRYNLKYNQFRANAIMQFGGYGFGNGSNGEWQVGVGGDFELFGGKLSIDGIYSHIRDQVNLGSYNGALPAGVPNNALKATINNSQGVMLLSKFTLRQVSLFGGWEHYRLTNPSGKFATFPATATVFNSLGGYPVVGSGINQTPYSGSAVPLNFDIFWTGVKYAINDRLDVTGAYYLYYQHDFNNYAVPAVNLPATCGANPTPAAAGFAPQGTKSSACTGWMNAFSAMIDYRPLKRVDLYAGFMYSRVSGGLATGYLYNSNFDPTVGARIRF